MAQRFFISYRRKDDAHGAGRLFEVLDAAFPGEVFMDVEGGIGLGRNFVTALQKAVSTSECVMVVIGANWLNAVDGKGRRKLDDPNDFVRIEIESAIAQGKRVIPVLMNDVEMPTSAELPGELKKLAILNAIKIRTDRFKADTAVLIKDLGGSPGLEAAHPTTPDEALRALERSRWQIINANPTIDGLKSFIRQFPSGVFCPVARIRLEEMAWDGLPVRPKIAQLKAFLSEFPDGAHADRAAELIKRNQAYDKALVGRFVVHCVFVGTGIFACLIFAAKSLNLLGRAPGPDPVLAILLLITPILALLTFYFRRRRWRRALDRPMI